MKYWKKLSHAEQDARISQALSDTIDYKQKMSLGIPASRLDPLVFYDEASFLKEAPLLRTYVQNPNHIGCHTLGESEEFFRGTQSIEREVIELLAVDIFKAEVNSCDGYIAAGGTEANIQAIWIYRNYFISTHGAKHSEIAIISSVDTHYSIAKAANLLHINWYPVSVDEKTRNISADTINHALDAAVAGGAKYFIVVSNLATTMFGSVDDPNLYAGCLLKRGLEFKLHVDGAFGGFIYPFSCYGSNINFANPHVSSITLDAHKMLQAPYGTGIFLARKGLMPYVYTNEASYVNGMDITLSGSRGGVNAIAIWMILFTYGPYGWQEKIYKLLYRTEVFCKELQAAGVAFYRNPYLNIVAIDARYVSSALAHKYGLVPDNHDDPKWYKVVVMDHVELHHLEGFVEDLKKEKVSAADPISCTVCAELPPAAENIVSLTV